MQCRIYSRTTKLFMCYAMRNASLNDFLLPPAENDRRRVHLPQPHQRWLCSIKPPDSPLLSCEIPEWLSCMDHTIRQRSPKQQAFYGFLSELTPTRPDSTNKNKWQLRTLEYDESWKVDTNNNNNNYVSVFEIFTKSSARLKLMQM